MKKKFKDYTKDELDKLMDKKWSVMCKKYPNWNVAWMEARDKLLDWYEDKLTLIQA